MSNLTPEEIKKWSGPALFGLGLVVGALPVNVFLNNAFDAAGGFAAVIGVIQLVLVPSMMLAGIVLSAVGISQTRKGQLKGRGQAIAGVIIGPIFLILWATFTLAYAMLTSV